MKKRGDAVVKIFMCCHKGFDVVPPLCIPVQGGAALNPPLPGAIPDLGAGGGISEKNPQYCELTVQYYAWKNEQADYYGFCHYRRFFCFDRSVKKAYLALGSLSKDKSRYLGNADETAKLIEGYGVTVPRAENMGVSAWEYYCASDNHFKEDISLFTEILGERLPELSDAAREYLSGTRQYFCNMFIMRKELFYDYCGKLFPLLEEFDRRKTLHGSFQADRTDGYLGERFLGIYLAWLSGREKVLELPRIDTGCGFKKRLGCILLPPESKARFAVRSLVKRSRKVRKG